MSNDFNWSKVLGDQEAEKKASRPQPLPAAELDEVAKLTEQILADQAARQKPAPRTAESPVDGASQAPEPLKLAQSSASELVLDPRTGLQASDDDVKAIKAQQLQDAQSRINYRPAAVDQSVHEIDISSHHFESMDKQEVIVQGDVTDLDSLHIDELLRDAIERKASDIHLTVGLPPMIRLDGEIAPLPYTPVRAEDSRRMIYDTLNDEQVQRFESTHELDFAYVVHGLARFRFNVYMQRGSVCGALRAIPTKIPSFETLGLPATIREIAKRSSGLILVTGPTGSGKSTTIASMIDDINDTRTSHILTIEDPIEYLHNHKKCMVNQREMHSDTFSFHNALRAVLREDPDIILVGELRDLETIEAALTLAETGHLVFGTLHTRNAPATIDRIIDVFPSDQQDQIRVLLGNTLEGVISQQLVPRLGGGRAAAIEIMIGTPAIKNLIREGKTHQMYSSIETGSQFGMQTMDASLAAHFKNGYCSFEECLMRAVDKESFSRLCKGAA